jgi:transcriptional regulator with XRE-family HTH domain
MATKKWKDMRPELVEGLGGEAVVAEAYLRNQTYIDAQRLAERRTALGLTQAEVADRMGITKSRVSKIERGQVSTVDVIARYVQAIGGQLHISAVFGDDLLILQCAGTGGGRLDLLDEIRPSALLDGDQHLPAELAVVTT